MWFYSGQGEEQRQALIQRIRRQLLTERKSADEPVDILLIGSDARGEESARSDTLIFVHVNFADERVYLISIPRDTRVSIPGRGEDKINAAYAYGRTSLAIRTIEEFLGNELNHFVEVDFEGFKQLVDTLGGVDITVDQEINDQSAQYRMHIPKGRQRMDGETALNYVRYRHGDSDFGRAERQQRFLRALATNTLRARTVLKLPKLVRIFDANITTDMSNREMLALANFLRGVPRNRIELLTVAGESMMIDGISFVEPDQRFVIEMMERIEAGRSINPMKSLGESGNMSMDYGLDSPAVLNRSELP